jgi:hypothetical protein
MINGFFRNGAGFVNAHLISEGTNIDETIEFLVDTGASRTTLLDKDMICLGIEYDKLRRYEQDLSGIGGSVETYVIDDAILLFGVYVMEMPVFVIRHSLDAMDDQERIRILRFPSILGRDVINKFRLIFDKEKDEILMGDKITSG